jgi:hypothetical protein
LKFVSIKILFHYYLAQELYSNHTLQQQSLYSQNLSETNSNKATFQIEDYLVIDTDGDGIPNLLDNDSDNDGIPDRLRPKEITLNNTQVDTNKERTRQCVRTRFTSY